VVNVEDWAEIRRLYLAEGMPIKAIARRLGLSRNTVRNAVRSVRPPCYRRPPKGSIVDGAEPQIRSLLEEFPDMPSTVIAERIGWTLSMAVLKDRVRELRPVCAPADPVSRTTYQPGERAQRDLWFPPAPIPVGFGRVDSPDLVLGQCAVIVQLGAVPRSPVWDNESGVSRYGGGRPQLTRGFTVLRGLLGTNVVVLRPRDPEAKGLVERANGYLETSFLPGRRFAGVTDSRSSWASGLPGSTPDPGGRWTGPRRPTGSARTGPRCRSCRRWSGPATLRPAGPAARPRRRRRQLLAATGGAA
jgi:transposase